MAVAVAANTPANLKTPKNRMTGNRSNSSFMLLIYQNSWMGGASQSPLLFSVQCKRCRIDAKAQSGGFWAVLENMAEVGVAIGAAHFDAIHAELVLVAVFEHIFADRLPEAGPAGAGFELGFRIEQRRATAHAAVDAEVMAIPIFAGEGGLGAALAAHFILFRRQFFAPFVVRFVCIAHLLSAREICAAGRALMRLYQAARSGCDPRQSRSAWRRSR